MQLGRGYGQGTERYLWTLAAGMRRRGHETVCIAGDPERRGPELPLGEVVQPKPLVLAYPTRGWMTVTGTPPEGLTPLLHSQRPDVVHLANPAHIGVGLIGAAQSLRIPVVVTIMDYWWLCPKHTLEHHQGRICDGRVAWQECLRCVAAGHVRAGPRLLARVPVLRAALLPPTLFLGALTKGLPVREVRRWTQRQAILNDVLNGADAVIFPSRTGRGLLEPRLGGPECHSIPYGLERRWFDSKRGRSAREGWQGGDQGRRDPANITVGYAGALAEHKGVHVFLKALLTLGWKATRVRIAGGGPPRYVAHLKQLATGLNVEFVGRLNRQQMPAFLSELDVLVAPSLWPENLPIVVLEAQACGVPVLGSRVGGIAEMLPGPDHLFEPNSSDSLAERLAAWCSGAIPPVTAKVSTADEMAARTLAVYERVVAGRDSPARERAASGTMARLNA
jgi:glycosyltransferase involved in cell wall biosynthesis